MPSQSTLVWVGAAALAVVIAGAGAVVWTHPDLLEQNPADIPLVARAPAESKPPIVPPAPPVPATPPASAPAPGDKTSTPGPAFDIVNVDPSGEAVIAGRAAPNAKVELHDGGKTVAEATADAAGQFVIIPPALAPGDHSLSLAASDDKAQPAISVRSRSPFPRRKPKVAAAAPNQSQWAARDPMPCAWDADLGDARAGQRLSRRDPIGRGRRRRGLVAKGSAEPNATVRLYLNQADLAEAKTQSDGRWSLTIKSGMSPGGYVMRADEIGQGDASVVASADTPFDYPDMPAPPRLRRPPQSRLPQAPSHRQRPRPPTR